MLRARSSERPLLCVGTGAGKTTIAAEVIRRATEKGRRSIFLVHRRELVDQAVERLSQFGIQAGRILAGHPEDRDLPVQVASIPTLLKRKHAPADLVIVDECSHAVSKSWKACLDRYPPPVIVIGLTATPIRLDGRGLGDLFGCIIEPVTTLELIRQGFLVNPRVFAPPVDLKGVRVVAGDYSVPELATRMSTLVGSITKTWQEHCAGQRTVAFAVNIAHSQAIVDAFRALGVRIAHVDYTLNPKVRAATLADLRDGRIEIVSQVQLLTEGWDLPSLQCAILARPTKSFALFRQMVGRIMRPPGPVTVLDHAGNHHEHGLVTDPVEWSLDTKRKKKSAIPAVRTCKECFAIIPATESVCPACGMENEPKETSVPRVENPGELVELQGMKTEFYRSMVQTAHRRGYTVGWARFRYKEKFGVWPRLRQIERDNYKCSAHKYTLKSYTEWKRVYRCEFCYDERPTVPV